MTDYPPKLHVGEDYSQYIEYGDKGLQNVAHNKDLYVTYKIYGISEFYRKIEKILEKGETNE
ncbi:MAG TPA: hypothetical protein VIH61_06660 [Waddliaceae bacterium]